MAKGKEKVSERLIEGDLMHWEHIDNYHTRARVFGGWIVKCVESVVHQTDSGMSEGWDWRPAMCFVPDPNHEWSLKDKLEDE